MSNAAATERPGSSRTLSLDSTWVLCWVLIAVVGVLVLLPIGYLVFGSLRSAPPRAPGAEFTLEHVSLIYASTTFLRPLLNTLSIGLLTGIFSVAIGAMLAWAVARTDIRRAGLWEALIVLPVYFSPLMLVLAFIALAAPRVGFINLLWQAVGGSGSVVDVYSYAGIIFVLTINYIPYAFLFLIGPIRAIGADLEEAAQVLGSRRGQIMRRILFPMLLPAMFASTLMIFTLAAENFAVPTLLGRQSRIETIPSQIYFWIIYEPTRPNLAAAAGTMLLLITIVGIMIYRRMTRLAGRYVTVSGKPRPAARIPLGKWRPVVHWLLGIYIFVTAVLPVAGLVFGSLLRFISRRINWDLFTLQNYRTVFSESGLSAMWNSLLLGLGAATIGMILGFLVSYSTRRTSAPGRGALDYLASLPIAVPGSVLGVGMLWAYVTLPLGIWGSMWVLLIAYVSRFIVHSTRVTSNSLLQLSGEFDEAARISGAGLARRLMDITAPLTSKALLSSWILIFIFAFNEVTSTLLLYSSRSTTLSVLIWNSLEMYGAMQAFAYAAVQAVITFAMVSIAYRLSGKVSW